MMKLGQTGVGGFDQMSKLLDLFANPDKAKSQLAELQQSIEYYRQIVAQAEEKKEQALQATKDLDLRAKSISQDLAKREGDVEIRESKVTARENALTRREVDTKAAREKLEVDRADHALNLSRIKSQTDEYRKATEKELAAIRLKDEQGHAALVQAQAATHHELDKREHDLELREANLRSYEADVKKREQLVQQTSATLAQISGQLGHK